MSEDDPRWERYEAAMAAGLVVCLSHDDDWMTLRDAATGRGAFPVWPDRERALACATEAWDGAEPTPIEAEDWLAYLAELEDDGDLVALEPDPDGVYLAVEPADLRA